MTKTRNQVSDAQAARQRGKRKVAAMTAGAGVASALGVAGIVAILPAAAQHSAAVTGTGSTSSSATSSKGSGSTSTGSSASLAPASTPTSSAGSPVATSGAS